MVLPLKYAAVPLEPLAAIKRTKLLYVVLNCTGLPTAVGITIFSAVL